METCPYTDGIMPRKSRQESLTTLSQKRIGERLARLRKERGSPRWNSRRRVGIIQSLISDYETDRLRMNPDMVVRFAPPWKSPLTNCFNPTHESMSSVGGPACVCCAVWRRSRNCLPISRTHC